MRLDDDGDLVISPLSAEDVPAETVALKAELTEMLPFAPIVAADRARQTHRLSGLFRHRHPILLGWAAVPYPWQVSHR